MTAGILSIQSHVAYGHVGNAAAIFPMQRLGFEVWPLHTVLFSNHPGHGGFRGATVEPALLSELVAGLEERGTFKVCASVLSGYLGSVETGAVVLDAVSRVKATNPAAIYACDPVIGDVGRGVYVRPDLPEFFRAQLVPLADVLTPNLFELELLSGISIRNRPDLVTALAKLHAMEPRIVLVTSVVLEDTPGDALDVVVSHPTGQHRLRTPRLACAINGAGDAIAALFLAHLLKGLPPERAMQRAVSSIFGVLQHTQTAGSREILLIEAQEELVVPSQVFAVEAL